MITVLTMFPMPQGTDLEAFTAKMEPTIARYQNVPGLLRKSYVFDADRSSGGGVYSFDSHANAKACFNDEFLERVRSLFGSVEVRYFETPIAIDNIQGVVHRTGVKR